MALKLLHGTFSCTIHNASDLVDDFRITGEAPAFLRRMVGVLENAVHVGRGPSRLYATVDMEAGPQKTARLGRTRMIEMQPKNPTWEEDFHIYCAHFITNVVISVKDDDRLGSHVLGRARIQADQILSGRAIKGVSLDLYKDGNGVESVGKIRVSLEFRDVLHDSSWGAGIGGQGQGEGEFSGVPFTFFPQRKGCQITLYQDAHMCDEFLPQIFLANGKHRAPTRLWEDIYESIIKAEHFIYIAGWSVFTEIKLRRDPTRGPRSADGETLGELLKRRASEGIKVVMLVWDDISSNSLITTIMAEGVMHTHDQDTANYFKGSQVTCLLCPRNPDNAVSMVQGLQIGTMFTHHQKLVCADAPITGGGRGGKGGRSVVAFVGGIDLCDGRYDDQRHALFSTLNEEHSLDFYQGCLKNANLSTGGPREPWHDIHACVHGPIAWDVLYNFEQRWRKQGFDGTLLDLSSHPSFIHNHLNSQASPQNHPDDASFNIQLFRSIDAGAAFGFPDTPEEAAQMGLVSGKDMIIERSIQDAYIHAIRRAKHFIYIENQYFLGSCHAWDTHNDAGCLHLIPIEIALKIVSKIEAGERFAVYIVIPMWPEGIVASEQVQAILDWQRRTVEMMYKLVAQGLRAKGITDEVPTDYLTFFCLGNREAPSVGEHVPNQFPEQPSHYASAQANRRLMIYVHSKMMIVDDEYIILGSANINQRSMDGGRDTELAIGAYQPAHIGEGGKSPLGEVHGFRMSLWYEHLGYLSNNFLEPWTLNCMREVKDEAYRYWEIFAGDSIVNMPGHLMTYPYFVSQDGGVSELPGHACFPDTNASVLGKLSSKFPAILTT